MRLTTPQQHPEEPRLWASERSTHGDRQSSPIGRWRKQFIRAAEDTAFCHPTGHPPARQSWAAALLPSQKKDFDPISLHRAELRR